MGTDISSGQLLYVMDAVWKHASCIGNTSQTDSFSCDPVSIQSGLEMCSYTIQPELRQQYPEPRQHSAII